jgi:hypothetical protein
MRTESVKIEHSRQLLLAGQVTSIPKGELAQALERSVVVVTIDPEMPLAELTARVFLTMLRRGPGELVLVRSGIGEPTVQVLEQAVAAVDGARPLRIENHSPRHATVRVHVGPDIHGGAMRLVPEGYGAHVVGWRGATIRPHRPGNPVGAIYTAALGAAEVFKHTANVVRRRRVLHGHLQFCPVTLSTDLQRAPELDGAMSLDLSIVGLGAIGTGIAMLLSELDADGTILVVDRQRFGPENVGTYSLGGAAEAISSPWKADLVASVLTAFDVTPFCDSVEQLLRAVDAGDVPWPRLVLTALDTPEARREAQRLWPDRLMDAATGDTMLGLCDYTFNEDPCLMCVFPVRLDEQSGTELLAERLGLPVDLLARGDMLLESRHLAGLSPEQTTLLEPFVGKPVCGLAQAEGLSRLEAEDFMPSVPFVSLQAACLSVGRLIADRLQVKSRANFIQYDGLVGPKAATIERMRRRPGCYCEARSSTIERVRERRGANTQTRPDVIDTRRNSNE